MLPTSAPGKAHTVGCDNHTPARFKEFGQSANQIHWMHQMLQNLIGKDQVICISIIIITKRELAVSISVCNAA